MLVSPHCFIRASWDFSSPLDRLLVCISLFGGIRENIRTSIRKIGRRRCFEKQVRVASDFVAILTGAHNANGQLTTWGTANLFYDVNGNMTSDGARQRTSWERARPFSTTAQTP